MRKMSIPFIITGLFLIGCSQKEQPEASLTVAKSWAFEFVVWDGYTYKLSDAFVDDVDEEIGEVTKYYDMEGSYSGNFSNVYEKGAKYYAMQGISTEEAIAIEEEGKYRIAIRDRKYGGDK